MQHIPSLVPRKTPDTTILVVATDPIIVDRCADILTPAGYRVLFANSTAAALDRCKECFGLRAVLVDTPLAGGTGTDLVEEITRVRPDAVLIFATSYQWEQYQPFSQKWTLRKPFTPRALLTTINQALADTPRRGHNITYIRTARETTSMAKCSRCGTETQLYDSGTPICLACVAELRTTREKKPPTKEEDTPRSRTQAG